MGCARSVPSVHASPSKSSEHNHADEHSITEDNENKENICTRNLLKINNYMGNENKTERVLPLCDNLEESLDIDNKNENCTLPSPLDDLVVVDFENKEQDNLNKVTETQDVPKDEHSIANEISKAEDIAQMDQNINDKEYKKFEEIVEDVVKISEIPNIHTTINSDTGDYNNASAILDVTPIKIKDLTEIELEGMEEEILSASSEGRATRWEALADIAAELPPSLTVDPLTGQIYTVSK